MDPDLLRLILLVLGILLVLAIYLRDRYKRTGRRRPPGARPAAGRRQQPVFNEPDSELEAEPEPGLESKPAVAPPAAKKEQPDAVPAPHEPLPAISASRDPEEPEPLTLTVDDALASDDKPPETTELNFSAFGETDYLHLDPELYREVPRQVVQINLRARGMDFTGEQILRAAAEVELQPGELDIFHRRDSDSGDMALFSMASMLEPGFFPLKNMQDYSTPGLTLFTQLPGIKDGLAIYSDMLFTAERLSAILNAELQDETHSALSRQTIEHTRELILEHRRQVQLAQRRS